MKSIRSSLFFRVLVLTIGVLGASVSAAHAQADANGTFSLPHETNWGGLVLPAGDYAFSLQSKSRQAQIVVRKASGSQLAIVVPRLVSEEKLTGDSRLVLRGEAGKSFVSTLYLGDLGLVFYFAPPKPQTLAPETGKLGPISDSQSAR